MMYLCNLAYLREELFITIYVSHGAFDLPMDWEMGVKYFRGPGELFGYRGYVFTLFYHYFGYLVGVDQLGFR